MRPTWKRAENTWLLTILKALPAGVALSAYGARRHAEVDDLVLEALQGLPPELLAGLPPLALLDVWNAADAGRLSSDLPVDWLRNLLRAGRPVALLGQGMFQPHQLLLQVLERLLGHDRGKHRLTRALLEPLERACCPELGTTCFMPTP